MCSKSKHNNYGLFEDKLMKTEKEVFQYNIKKRIKVPWLAYNQESTFMNRTNYNLQNNLPIFDNRNTELNNNPISETKNKSNTFTKTSNYFAILLFFLILSLVPK